MWVTKHPNGMLPAGMKVEVITLSLTGGPKAEYSRDYHLDKGSGDGQWFLVKYPNGVIAGQVRTVEELTVLGIDMADLEETAS